MRQRHRSYATHTRAFQSAPSGDIWHLLEQARASPMTPAEVVEQLTASLRRNVTSLARRERRGCQTAYDEVLERDVEAIARAIVFLQEQEVHP